MTTLIKNGLVYDGVSPEPRRADVLFDTKKIRAVRPLLRASALRVIDASGCAVIPGLIDTGSSIDRYGGLFSEDIQKEFVRRGITTVIAGGGGASLAPFRADVFHAFFYPSDSFSGNADWVSFGDFLNALRATRLWLHAGSLAGYRNIFSPFASPLEIRQRAEAVLQDGALGISFDWDDAVSYPVSLRNLEAAAEVLASAKKACSLYLDSSRVSFGALHLFSRMFARLRAKFHISRFRPHASLFPEWESGRGFSKYADISLSSHLPYPIYGFLPSSFRCLEFAEMQRRVRLVEYEDEILTHLRALPLSEVLIAHLPHHLRHLEGKRFRDLVFRFLLSLPRTVLHCMRLSDLKAVLLLKNSSSEHALPFLRHSSSTISSGGTLPLCISLRDSQTFQVSAFPRLAESSGLLTGEVLAKMTSLPAKLYGIRRRGKIAEGFHPDLAVLKNWNVARVFVQGELAFENGVFHDTHSGKVIVD